MVIPLTVAFWVFILFFFRVMQVETEVQEALYCAGRETAAEACLTNSEEALIASAGVRFQTELSQYEPAGAYIQGGRAAVSLLESKVENDTLCLRASYYVKLPISFFQVKGIRIIQNSVCHLWTGRNVAEEEDEDVYVYITESGSVYHRSTGCSYLNPSIHSVSYSVISGLRSSDGSIYYACPLCGASDRNSGTVYYTTYGTNYHSSLSCSGLKRTIHMVRLSDVAGMKACSKCGGND